MRVWKIENGEPDEDEERIEQRLYVHSKAKQQKEDAILTNNRARFETELRRLHDCLAKPGHTKKYERVLERVGLTRARYAKVSRQNDIDVERDSGSGKKRPGFNAVAVSAAIALPRGKAARYLLSCPCWSSP